MDFHLFPLKELIKDYDQKNPTRTLLVANQVKTELEGSDVVFKFLKFVIYFLGKGLFINVTVIP